jgi:lysyl-tRNA synthetase class 2
VKTPHRRNWEQVRRGERALAPLLARERAVDAIRAFFKRRGFNEVDTPVLAQNPGMEPHLEVFESRLHTAAGVESRAFLVTSPEYAMKKLLAAGLPRIFQVGHAFRNREEVTARHNPEFTILEWYRAGEDYRALMPDCEEMFGEVVRAVRGPATDLARFDYQGQPLDLRAPWERLSVRDAFARYAVLDLDAALDRASMAAIATKRGYLVESETTWEQIYHQIFLNEVEPELGRSRPTFLYDYPLALAALARANPRAPGYAERFEWYAGGLEIGNAFSELVDPDEQTRRLASERLERRVAGRTDYDPDADFLHALRVGMPPAAGIAVGVDRLVMLAANARSIRDVTWFPADDLFDALRDD